MSRMVVPGTKPLLLVEDEMNDVILMQRAFRKANLLNPLHVVHDGDAAIAYLAGEGKYANRDEHPLPVLIMLDLKLPRRSGLEVLGWLRAQPTLKRIPVVILTSSRESVDLNQAYDLGANSYLVKPVSFDSLSELVKNLNLYWLILNEPPQV